MEAEALTKQRIEEYLRKGKRFDGRKLLEFRNIEIETGVSKNAEGSARVKIGDTEVLVGVKMGIGTPYPDHEDEGTLMVSAELSPLASTKYESGPPKFDSIELSRVIDRGLRESGFIEFKNLNIKGGEAVWNIFVDIYPMNDAGNVLDAASIGAVAALKTARMPKFDEEKNRVLYGELSENKLPINDKITPINLTFNKVGDSMILDPTTTEEYAVDNKIFIALSEYEGKVVINSVQNSMVTAFSIEELDNILDKAEEIFKKYSSEIIKKIK